MKQPHLRCEPRDINKFCLLPGDPGRVKRIAEHLTSVRMVGENRGYLIMNGEYEGVPVTVCSTGMGGPSIAIAIHELVACGAKVLIRVGSCGALQKGLKLGDTIVVEGAVRSESTSNLYAPREVPAYANKDVFKALKQRGVKSGFVNSHDGFYHKGSNEMDKFWSRLGLLGSDFESAPLFIIADYLKVKAGSVLNVVSSFGGDDAAAVASYASGKGPTMKGERKSIMIALSAIKKMRDKIND